VSDPGNSLGVTRFSQNQPQIYHHQQVNNNPRNSYYNSNNLINPADCSCYYAENHHPVNNPRENNLGAVVTGISVGASDASGVKCSCDLLQSDSFNQQSSYPSAVPHQLPQQQHGPYGNSSFSYNVISGSGHHQSHPASGLYHHSQAPPLGGAVGSETKTAGVVGGSGGENPSANSSNNPMSSGKSSNSKSSAWSAFNPLKDVVRSVIGASSGNKVQQESSAVQGRKSSSDRKHLQKSLAELKLDLPRVQGVSTNATSVSSDSSQQGAVNRGRSRSNESSGKGHPHQQVPIPRVHPKRSSSQAPQAFHRNYHRGNGHAAELHQSSANHPGHRTHGRSTRHNLLRATISHKAVEGRREAVFTAWDNPHGLASAHGGPPLHPLRGHQVFGPGAPHPKHRSLEEPSGGPHGAAGPRSLPNPLVRITPDPAVPRAPIPTPGRGRPPPPTLETTLDVSLPSQVSDQASFCVDTTHYSTPNDRDGDYSYAYDSSLSPAFIIKYDDGGSEASSEDEGKGPHKKAQQENIYEEIAESHSGTSDGSSGGSGGHSHSSSSLRLHSGGARSKTSNHSENSSRKSSSMNSDSGISMTKPSANSNSSSNASSSNKKYSQGTLDVAVKGHGSQKRKETSRHPHRTDEKLSALDSLLFQTAPGMTASQRRDLRKSLVDEVFEELIRRHHDRVLDQLKLDVEDFISPNESASNSSKLKKCESMDFKDLSSVKKEHVAKENTVTSGLRAALLKKLPEAFNRKYFSGSVKKEDAERVKAAVIGSGTSPASGGNTTSQSNHSNGHERPLPLPSENKLNNNCDDSFSMADIADMDDEEGPCERRLRRSQIIQSFLQQSDFTLEEEESDGCDPDDFSDSENCVVAKKNSSAAVPKEPATIITKI